MSNNLRQDWIATIVTSAGASITWIEKANEIGKLAATVIAVVVGLFTLWKHVEERFIKK